MSYWQTSRRRIPLGRTLVMAIINVTPDSFSDGGEYFSVDAALRRAEQAISEGADILDIGGESTRPGSGRVDQDEEIARIIPVIDAVSKEFDIPISVDTWKAEVARQSIASGAEIINDISGLRWVPELPEIAASSQSGLVLMHSLGEFETMHKQAPVKDIFAAISEDFERSAAVAKSAGIREEQIVLDIGLGFGKSLEQNLGLLAGLDRIAQRFENYPILVGASRKSFIGKVLGDVPTDRRLYGSLATAVIAAWNGARILRVHDVKATVDAVRMTDAVRDERSKNRPSSVQEST